MAELHQAKKDPVPMLIIGADTVVAFDGANSWENLSDKEDAFRTAVFAFRERRHQVYTGVTLLLKKKEGHLGTFYIL